jgi:hypothetical protein
MHDLAEDAPTVGPAERLHLSVEMALDLILCGMLMAGLPFLAHQLQPDLPHPILIIGLVGGGLCVLWGVLGRRGMRCRRVAITTLATVAGVFLWQAIQSWSAAATGQSKPRMVAMLMALMVVFCAALVANLAGEARRPQP